MGGNRSQPAMSKCLEHLITGKVQNHQQALERSATLREAQEGRAEEGTTGAQECYFREN